MKDRDGPRPHSSPFLKADLRDDFAVLEDGEQDLVATRIVDVASPSLPKAMRPEAAALAGEFPALGNPQCAWSHEPVLPMGGDFATLLHFETAPGLITLATELARRGVAVESAWPMATFLHALPKEWSDSGAVTVVAVEKQRAVAYRHPADGVRSVPVWLGEMAVTEVGEWLGELLTQSPEEPVLLVCADAATATALGAFVSVEDYPGVEQITLNEALARPGAFPRYHPAQLLPRSPIFTAQRFLIAASIAFLLAAAWSGVGVAHAALAGREAARDQQTRLTALRTEVAQLRANADEISALRRSLESGAAGPPCGALLDAVATTVPASITLTSLRITGRTVAIGGWVAPGASPTAVEDWRSRLAPASAPWTVSVKTGATGAFTLTGLRGEQFAQRGLRALDAAGIDRSATDKRPNQHMGIGQPPSFAGEAPQQTIRL